MAGEPAFLLYARDWLASQSITLMSDAAEATYVRLLCHQALAGSLPADPRAVQKCTRIDAKKWPKVWAELEPHFPLSEDGSCRKNARLADEQARRAGFLESRKSASAKGVAARRGATVPPEPPADGAPHGQPCGQPHGAPDGQPDGQPLQLQLQCEVSTTPHELLTCPEIGHVDSAPDERAADPPPEAGGAPVAEPAGVPAERVPPAPRVTWLTPYAEAWAARGGHFVGSREARALKRLEEEYGAAETLRRWERMLDRVSELRFASAALLLRSWGDYGDDVVPAPARRGEVVYESADVLSARLLANLRASTGGARGAGA